MATVITTPQVGNSYCPQMKLTATISSQTDTSATIRVVVDYVTYGYTFSSSSSPEVSEKINGTWYDESGWSLNGKTSQRVRDRSVTVSKGTSAKSIEVKLYWGMSGFKWAGSSMSDWNLAGSISVPAKTSYTVAYDANGGSGAPSSQTKWHGTALTLSDAQPTRADHEFVEWNTAADGSGTSYAPGASYTANAAATLYAVWQESYTPPTITSLTAIRCTSGGTADDSGTYAKVEFGWAVDTSIYQDNEVDSIAIAYSVHNAGSWASTAIAASGTSGSVSQVLGTFATASSYDIRVTVTDSHGSASMFVILSQAFFTLDVLAGGHGIALGKASERYNYYENAFPNVYFQGESDTYLSDMDGFIADLVGAKGVELYKAASGTSSTISITDYDLSDFDHITIMYGKLDSGNGGYQSTTVYDPVGKNVVLSQMYSPTSSTATYMQWITSKWAITSHAITPAYNGRRVNRSFDDGTFNASTSDSAPILIYRVVGYTTKREIDAATGAYTAGDGIAISGSVISATSQNFGVIDVDGTEIVADDLSDTLTLAAGSNVTLTPDASTDTITIAATDTVTSVTVTQTLSSGTAIADIDVDGTTTTLYAPSSSSSVDAGQLVWYAECSTASATVAKVATTTESGFVLQTGVMALVRFSATNTGAVGSLTLSVNDTGAYAIKTHRNNTIANLGAPGVLYANVVVPFIFSGTYWFALENYNTTYSVITEAEATAGTSTATRLVTPARLNTAIQSLAPVKSVSVTQSLSSGTAIGSIDVDGTSTTLYAPAGSGGGSTVSVSQTLTSGTESAVLTIDGVSTSLYAPTPVTQADYVVEQGGTAATGYRKWSSGIMEAWVTQTSTTTVSTAWGNLYRSDSITGSNWPATFATITSSYSQLYASGGEMAWFGSSGGESVSKATNGYILRGATQTSSVSFRIRHYAMGTWS